MFLKEKLQLVEYLSQMTLENLYQLMHAVRFCKKFKRQSISCLRETRNVCSLEDDLEKSQNTYST